MSKKKQQRRRSPSRIKIVLVAILGLVFAGVWGNALLGGKPKSTAKQTERRAAPRSRAAIKPRTNTQAPAVQASQPKQPIRKPLEDWPSLPLDQATLNDPFAKPRWAIVVKEKPAESQAPIEIGQTTTREQMEQAGASMIVIAGDTKIATIGNQEVRVGDVLGGFTVVDITPAGVVFADKSTNN